MEVRRVVTGHDAEGKAVCVVDDLVVPVTLVLVPGSEFHQIWGADSACSFPDAGSRPRVVSYFPPLGGFRFGFFTIPPDRGGGGVPVEIDVEATFADLERDLPGLAHHLELDNPGMHTTATIDCGIVLSGQATIEGDNGAKVALNVGDTYIQNGTRHRWSNLGDVPAVLAITMIGANHRKVG
jgi:mannose-6-phosphate isomerase-like protein (cupin superfamily)